MSAEKPDPVPPADAEARALARDLIAAARFGALGTIEVETGAPMVTRIALVPGPDGLPLSLVSELSAHTAALHAHPLCSVLLGEPGPKGDPLTHPRLTLQARATFVPHGHPDHTGLCAHYLRHAPKARLYIGFADFSLLRFALRAAHLNGGFGKAYRLGASDLTG